VLEVRGVSEDVVDGLAGAGSEFVVAELVAHVA
jgi:hypothetical protein